MDPILAYIDPGSGSLVVQALIAGLVAVPIFFRHQITRFARAIGRNDETPPSAPSSPDDGTAGG